MKSVSALLPLLTLEEKVALVAGYHFMSTNPIPRLGIPSIKTSDGPHGLRAQPEGGDNGVTKSLPATCFPTASCSANSFRPSLLYKMGQAMAEEAQYYGVSVILGPGVNIKRNPRCGRNFEYFSEDPFLAGVLGEAEVNGIQSQGIGTSLKHFAANNAENFRFMGNSVVDERALRELYLRQFEHIVKKAKPETVMAAYNKLNGVHCSEHEWLLHDVLRKDWGYQGLVMSDWGTTHDRIRGIRSGLDLEMPGDNAICRKWLVDAVNGGSLSLSELDQAVTNVLTLVEKHAEKEPRKGVDWENHNTLSREIAEEGAVLLKNDGSLPLSKEKSLLIIGDLFEKARYQGAGSSLINPRYLRSPKEAFDGNGVDYRYVRGYRENDSLLDETLINEAVEASNNSDQVLLFAGLTDAFECEGADRSDICLPPNQLALIEALVKRGKKPIVVLFGGGVVELPFYEDIPALLNMFLAGQNAGEATYRLLYGEVCPSGRLAETWPLSYQDVPFGEEFAKVAQDVYKESIYVGYRYYLTANKEVRFPFGYGLSYTSFAYGKPTLTRNGDTLEIQVEVSNTGNSAGAEVVQVYVSSPYRNVHKPKRELKGFAKVDLKPGESINASIVLNIEDLTYWDSDLHRFVLEGGTYEIEIGRNSRDIEATLKVDLDGERHEKIPQKEYETLDFSGLTDEIYERLWATKIPSLPPKKPIILESRLSDLKATFMGRIFYRALQGVPKKEEKKAKKMPEGKEKENKIKGAQMLRLILDSNSIISLSMSSSGALPYNLALMFVDMANGHLIRGIKDALTKVKAPELPVHMSQEETKHGKK